MEAIMEFVKPELLVLVPVLYFIGIAMKKSEGVKDKHIPALLGICGVILAALWVVGTSAMATWQEITLAVFTAIVQGVICAGLSVYVDQVIKQGQKVE